MHRHVLISTLILVSVFLTLTMAKNAYADDPILSVTGSAAYAEPGGETTYHIELLNHTDQIVYDGVISITLPISFTYVPGSTTVLGEGWPLESHEPVISGTTLTWGPYHLPAAGVTAHNPYGIHTLMHDCRPGLHLDGAKELAGNGGYVKQLFYGLDTSSSGPSDCAVSFVNEAYARNLIPILRLQGHFVDGVWQAPSPGPDGDYSEIAQAYARYVSGLPRRDTNPLYIEVWNEPDLWIEWNHRPNATQYARFFVAVSNAIKQLGDARIRVINGALTPGNMTFLKQMLQVPGFKYAFDAWSTHCYPYNHPASYNIHNSTARYSTYAIDCYLNELKIIKQYGRKDAKVIISETGYELGNNTFGFEGYSSINETNRAKYISSAFANYWQKWPEVIAVTPFQMSDSSGQWRKFDWLYPTPPYLPHAQYDTVSTLPKPVGSWQPYGYQVNFSAKISPTVALGVYTSTLSGSERSGYTTTVTNTVPVEVKMLEDMHTYFLPIIMTKPPTTGPWYISKIASPAPGSIVPTHFLQAASSKQLTLQSTNTPLSLPLTGIPLGLDIDEEAGIGAIILTDPNATGGYLQVFDLAGHQLGTTLSLEGTPQLISTDTPQRGQAYVSLNNGLILIDLKDGKIIRQLSGLGRMRGMAYDTVKKRLFAADAEHERLLIFDEDLSTQLSALPLPGQPNQLAFNPTTGQLHVSFPAISQIAAIDAGTGEIQTLNKLTGGPMLDMVFDSQHQRLYVLNLLAPNYRGLTVLETPSLNRIALVAGTNTFPLQRASAILLTPDSQLLVSEVDGLWQIDPISFSTRYKQTTLDLSPANGLKMDQNGTIYMLEGQTLKIYQ